MSKKKNENLEELFGDDAYLLEEVKEENAGDFYPEQEFYTKEVGDIESLNASTTVSKESVDPLEIVWYKNKYKTSLVKRGDEYLVKRDDSDGTEKPVDLKELLKALGIEEDLEELQVILWVRGLALPEQLDKLDQGRLADLVKDVRKRNK